MSKSVADFVLPRSSHGIHCKRAHLSVFGVGAGGAWKSGILEIDEMDALYLPFSLLSLSFIGLCQHPYRHVTPARNRVFRHVVVKVRVRDRTTTERVSGRDTSILSCIAAIARASHDNIV